MANILTSLIRNMVVEHNFGHMATAIGSYENHPAGTILV